MNKWLLGMVMLVGLSGVLLAQNPDATEMVVENFDENPSVKYPGQWTWSEDFPWLWSKGMITSGLIGDNQESLAQKEQRLIAVINDYNQFISQYPDRILSRIAIHECFQLYTMVNRISFYENFVRRYPYTEHSLVALDRIKLLLYNLVCAQNSIEAYEKFLPVKNSVMV